MSAAGYFACSLSVFPGILDACCTFSYARVRMDPPHAFPASLVKVFVSRSLVLVAEGSYGYPIIYEAAYYCTLSFYLLRVCSYPICDAFEE